VVDEQKYTEILSDEKNFPIDIAQKSRIFLPKYLYRYRKFNPEFWEKEIFNGEIYLPKACELNDPMDCLIYFDFKKLQEDCYLAKELEKRPPYLKFSEARKILQIPEKQQEIFKGTQENVRVASFTEKKNNLLMWSHYANFHQGLCIQYTTSKLETSLLDELFPVYYSAIKPDITEELMKGSNNAVIKAFAYKAKAWEYEQEWRVIKTSGSKKRTHQKDAISAIYLGAKCPDDDKREKIIQWAKANRKRVYQMKISQKEYNLEEEKLV